MLIDEIRTKLGLTSNSLTRKFAYFLKPENYDYMVFYPPYNNLYSADITPSRDLEEHLKQINEQEPKISFFFAIPWCRQKCPYCLYHCNVKRPSENDQRDYLDSLIQELELYLKHLGQCSVDTVYIGGGTPSLLEPSLLEHFLKRLSSAIGQNEKSLNNLAELNFEIHPNDNYKELIPILKNYISDPQKLRISLGAQSFIDQRIKNIRDKNVYKNTRILKAFDFLCNSEVKVKTNVDLMWGLSGKDISDELDFIKNKGIYPTTFTFYQIQSPGDIERHENYVKNIEKDTLEILRQREKIFDTLVDSHYEPILFPAYFQNKKHGAIYNTKQMAKNCYYIGLGVSGHSKLERWAYRNTEDIKRYIELVTVGKFPIDYVTKLSDDDIKKRDNLLRMRLPDQTFQKNYLTDLFKDTTDENDIDELLETFFVKNHENYKLNEKGKIFVDEIIRCAIKNDVSLMARFDKRIISTYIDRNKTERNERKIKNILSFMKNTVGQILVQETNIKEFVANIGYTSEHLPRPVINENPIGLINYRDEWKTAFENFVKLQDDKVYFFSELFNSLIQIGIAYPLSFAGNAFGLDECGEVKDSEKIFERLRDAIKSVKDLKTLNERYEEAKAQKLIGSFWAMFNLFHWYVKDLDEDSSGGQKNLYFLMTRTATASTAGAAVALRLEDPNKARLCLSDLTRYIEEIYTLVSEAEFRERMINFAMGSAIAAIMGRNMSHNLGSHAIWYLAQRLNNNDKSSNSDKRIDDGKMKDFLDYVRERMGFVGLVSTTQPSWTSSEGLEKVINRFRDGIVKKHIVQSEIKDAKYEIKYINKVNKDKDVLIDFPHASYGHQAFYVILENIIRNSIKHNIKNLPDQCVKFFIKVSQPVEEGAKRDFYRISVSDNIKCCNSELIEKLTEHIQDDILKKDGSLNNQYLGMKEKKIASAFLRLEKTDVLLPGADQPNPPLLKIHCCKEQTDCRCFEGGQCSTNGNLVFDFYLRKPKECLIVSGRDALQTNKDILSVHGIDVCNDVNSLVQWQVPHRFIIFDFCNGSGLQQDMAIEHIRKYRMGLPYRIGFIVNNGLTFEMNNEVAWEKKVFMENKDIIKIVENLHEKSCQNFIKALWKAWWDKIKPESPELPKLYFVHEGLIKEGKQSQDAGLYAKYVTSNYVEGCDNDSNNIIIFCHDTSNISPNSLFYYDEYSGDIQELVSYKSECLLYESCLYKVAVVDERINMEKEKEINLAKKSTGMLKMIWEHRRLKIIDHDPIIGEMDFSKVTAYNPHILIIHLGVLDKARKDREAEFDKKWATVIGKIPWIVIDSDRGKRSEEIKKYGGRWLHFSELGRTIVNNAEDYKSKLDLINIITSLREEND